MIAIDKSLALFLSLSTVKRWIVYETGKHIELYSEAVDRPSLLFVPDAERARRRFGRKTNKGFIGYIPPEDRAQLPDRGR